MTDYLEKVNKHIIDASNKARKHRDGKAGTMLNVRLVSATFLVVRYLIN